MNNAKEASTLSLASERRHANRIFSGGGYLGSIFGLDADDSLGEILFGLIMVLTFTLGAGLAASGNEEEARVLILGAIGCNIAWGLIDAVFYVMGQVFVRSRRARLRRAFRSAEDKRGAIALVRGELDPQLEPVTEAEDREHLYEHIYDLLDRAPAPPTGIKASDLKAALGVFLLVSLTAVPAALPFLFVDDPGERCAFPMRFSSLSSSSSGTGGPAAPRRALGRRVWD